MGYRGHALLSEEKESAVKGTSAGLQGASSAALSPRNQLDQLPLHRPIQLNATAPTSAQLASCLAALVCPAYLPNPTPTSLTLRQSLSDERNVLPPAVIVITRMPVPLLHAPLIHALNVEAALLPSHCRGEDQTGPGRGPTHSSCCRGRATGTSWRCRSCTLHSLAHSP